MVWFLDAQDIEVNKKSSRGKTALHIAIDNRNQRGVKLLLDKDADVNGPRCEGIEIFKTHYSMTPFGLAVLVGVPDIVKLLLDSGRVNPDVEHGYDGSVLCLAVGTENTENTLTIA
jgi:ankyrin repeat protein